MPSPDTEAALRLPPAAAASPVRFLRPGSPAEGLFILLLFIVGIAVRIVLLDRIPAGLNQDEAAIGYDAWALLQAGIDRNGVSWPVHFISWGSGQNALYAYLSMPFIALAGLSVLSIRMLAASSGVLALILFWWLGRISGRMSGGMSGRGMSACALLLIVTSPWHLMASRWALEANILPVIVLVACCLFARAQDLPSRLPLAAAVIGVSVYAYGTAYLFAPLFLLSALLLVAAKRRYSAGTAVLSLTVAGLVALPLMGFLLNNMFGTHTLQIGPISLPHYTGPARYDSVFLPFSGVTGWARTQDNARVIFDLVFRAGTDGWAANAIPGWGAQYLLLGPFVLCGALYACRRAAPLVDQLMLAWFVCALITLAMTEANINRLNLIWLPSLWLAARSFWLLRQTRFLFPACTAVLLVSFGLFCAQYFGPWRAVMAEGFFDGLGESVAAAVADAPAGAHIEVTDHANMPYITTLVFARTPPRRFVETADIPDRTAVFQGVVSFDRFHFGIRPGLMAQQRYWVAHRDELGLFDAPEFVIESHGDYAYVRRISPRAGCERALEATALQGGQDFGVPGVNAEVGGNGEGFNFAGQHFRAGIGVHGDSRWVYRSTEPLQALRFGVGITDGSDASDGMRFVVLADGKPVFDERVTRIGRIGFQRVALHGAHELTLQSFAGGHNRSDHGNWVRPVLELCNP